MKTLKRAASLSLPLMCVPIDSEQASLIKKCNVGGGSFRLALRVRESRKMKLKLSGCVQRALYELGKHQRVPLGLRARDMDDVDPNMNSSGRASESH